MHKKPWRCFSLSNFAAALRHALWGGLSWPNCLATTCMLHIHLCQCHPLQLSKMAPLVPIEHCGLAVYITDTLNELDVLSTQIPDCWHTCISIRSADLTYYTTQPFVRPWAISGVLPHLLNRALQDSRRLEMQRLDFTDPSACARMLDIQ